MPPASIDPDGTPQPCPVVVVDAAHSFASQAPALYDDYEGGGCRLPAGGASPSPVPSPTPDACDAALNFPADSVLRCVQSEFEPPLPQGPITGFTPPPMQVIELSPQGRAGAGIGHDNFTVP